MAYGNNWYDGLGLTPQQLGIAQQQMNTLVDANKLGFNMPTARLGIEGLGTVLGGLTALGGLNQAKKQFNFQKGVTERNMANSVKDYNRQMGDQIEARAAQQGNMARSQIDEYKRLNELKAL